MQEDDPQVLLADDSSASAPRSDTLEDAEGEIITDPNADGDDDEESEAGRPQS